MFEERFIKSYRVSTGKNINEIFSDINFRAQRQKKNMLLRLHEPINYNKLIIDADENKIQIDRTFPFPWEMPGRGSGRITLDFFPLEKGTEIVCTLDPNFTSKLTGWAMMTIIPISILFIVLIILGYFSFGLILFALIVLTVVSGIGYFSLSFNMLNLESYCDTLLIDLGIKSA
jgi:hypothetical protein